jgi:hypothetical protein
LLALVLLISPAVARAEDWEESRIAELKALLGVGPEGLSAGDLEAKLKEAIGDPETLNKVLQRFVEGPGERWRLLKDLHLQFKSFNADEGNEAGLGLSYQYAKEIKRQELSETSASQKGLTFSFAAEGNVAFEEAINPRDFLETRLDFAFFRSAGGAVAANPAVFDQLNALELLLAEEPDEATLDRSPEWQQFDKIVQSLLTTQTYVDVGATVSFESNQSFTATQWVYRGQVGFDVKSWNREASLSQWNVFDWPFALVRFLDGADSTFTPRGSTIPTLMVGVDWVDPDKNPAREALGAMDAYARFRLESAFKTLMAREGDRDIFFLADFRYYGELDAPDAIQTADLDEFVYFTSAITIGESLFVSYSDGRLPFDAADDQVYELGFQLVF